MKNPDYLTDDQLMQLIESVESSDLILAPDYLKKNILEKSVPRQLPRQHEFLFFSAKIITAAAASIALLFAMPDFEQMGNFPQQNPTVVQKSIGNTAEDTRDDSFFRKFNQKANRLCSIISDSTNSIFEKEDHEK